MRLSICIPTYNRSRFLADLIDSIVCQSDYSCELEIVISDNASVDNTRDVVESYRSLPLDIVYHKFDKNQGADRNFLKVVELSSGTFCWLMGDDDILEPGSIKKIEDSIKHNPEVAGLTVNRNAYSVDLRDILVERPVLGGALDEDTILHNADNIFSVLSEYFGFISGQVVRRSLWISAVEQNDPSEYFNAYVHVYIIGSMLKQNPSWLYVAQKCVGWRSGNDSFMGNGLYNRIMIDVVGLEKIAGDLFGKGSKAYHSLNRTVGSVHVRYALAGAKLNKLPASFFVKITPVLVRYYWRYGSFWARTVPVMVTPSFTLRMARWTYRKTIKSRRQRRLDVGND